MCVRMLVEGSWGAIRDAAVWALFRSRSCGHWLCCRPGAQARPTRTVLVLNLELAVLMLDEVASSLWLDTGTVSGVSVVFPGLNLDTQIRVVWIVGLGRMSRYNQAALLLRSVRRGLRVVLSVYTCLHVQQGLSCLVQFCQTCL
jgi:hypothetical protein